MDYFSIDDILMNETKIKVKFRNKINNFGFYLSESTKDIDENKNVELPYFLIKFLIENKHCEAVEEILPKEIKNELKACSSIVCLNQIYPYFYLFLSNFDDTKEFARDILIERISKFSKMIIKENLDEDDIYFMDQSEKKVLLSAREFFKRYSEE
ncbi:DNA replication complex GINS protein PSF3 [Nosema granulosis]|uniref:DNA replication complex GINS protein PSF3 n=1 Tax=Nosema granulosis TaxID=83296 RepID=A0A9P6KZE1_9MICR|nr:DNA replication complex GINS protein PSF3 [Nosema granulosis]